MDSEDGKALLGTPNGSSVAWLLIQHKAMSQLWHKTVKKVTILSSEFTDDDPGHEVSSSLLFWIEYVVV
jgi:hypothetical protein